jgi:hypothetical protein
MKFTITDERTGITVTYYQDEKAINVDLTRDGQAIHAENRLLQRLYTLITDVQDTLVLISANQGGHEAGLN